MTTAGRPRTCFAPARKSPGTARCSWGELVRLYRSAQPALPSAAPPPPPTSPASLSVVSNAQAPAGLKYSTLACLKCGSAVGVRVSNIDNLRLIAAFIRTTTVRSAVQSWGINYSLEGGIKGAKQEKKRRGLRRPMRMHQLSPDLFIPSLPGNAYTDWF